MGAGDLIIRYNRGDHEGQIKKIWEEINKLRCRLADCCEENSGCIPTVNGIHGCIINLTTSDVPEGSNLYYTNARVQSFSDPRYAFKNHTHVLAQITDFPSQAGETGKVLFTNGTAPYWATVPPGYTDPQAVAAVGAALVDSDSIDFTYSGGIITADVRPSFIYGLLSNVQIKFRVGDTDAPAAGDTGFSLKYCNGSAVVQKHIKFYRERFRQYPEDDYSYNSSTGDITLTIPFIKGERIMIDVYPQEIWTDCQIGTTPLNATFPYTFPYILA